MSFTERAARVISSAGVPLETVMSESLRIEPHGEGFILKWTGAVILTEEETALLTGPDLPPGDLAQLQLARLDEAIARAKPSDVAALVKARDALQALISA